MFFFFAHKNIIWQNYCSFDYDISDISLQYWLNVLRVMGEDGARGKDWLTVGHGGITCVLQTQFSSSEYILWY